MTGGNALSFEKESCKENCSPSAFLMMGCYEQAGVRVLSFREKKEPKKTDQSF